MFAFIVCDLVFQY